MRPRINTNRICSSDRYEDSKRAHTNSLQRNHNLNAEELQTLVANVQIIHHYTQVRIWGRWMDLPNGGDTTGFEGFTFR